MKLDVTSAVSYSAEVAAVAALAKDAFSEVAELV